jgi:hypothetical protein
VISTARARLSPDRGGLEIDIRLGLVTDRGVGRIGQTGSASDRGGRRRGARSGGRPKGQSERSDRLSLRPRGSEARGFGLEADRRVGRKGPTEAVLGAESGPGRIRRRGGPDSDLRVLGRSLV